MAILEHQLLGKVQGKPGDSVVQYLGIKYASLRERFSAPELLENYAKDKVIDATRLGPTAPSLPNGLDFEYGLIQQSLPKPDLTQSDLECLNLNITVPANIDCSSKLPVFVFIHGGGFIIGANSWPQYDCARLVKLSVEEDLPFIGLTINYRLGLFGFLTSEELRDAGYSTNNGLRDQRTALEWTKKYIGGFGGDGERITVAGESAGGASATWHLFSEKPLYDKLMSMSGTFLLRPPIGPEAQEESYNAVLKLWELESKSPSERIAALLKIPSSELISKLPPSISFNPAADGDIVPSKPLSYAQVADASDNSLPGRRWCRNILIGDCQMNASVMPFMIAHKKDGSAKAFTSAIKSTLSASPSEAETILQAYHINETASDDEAFAAVLNFANDLQFYAPVWTFVEGWPTTGHVYHFNEPNPWPGPFQGQASHVLDVAYLFQNYTEHLNAAQRTVGLAFAKDVIKYVNNLAPWPGSYDGAPAVRVYGPSSKVSAGSTAASMSRRGDEGCGRRNTLFEVSKVVPMEVIAKAWGVFMSGK